MIDYILFAMISLSFILIVLSAVFFYRERILEDKRLKGGMNCLFVGLVFFGIFLLYKSLSYGLLIYDNAAIPYGFVIEIASVTLMMLFFLVGMIIFREV